MNKNNLKSYAPQARKDFIAAVKARANLLGLSDDNGTLKIAEATVSGDVAIIAGREWPAKVEKQRQALIQKMRASSFSQTIEAVAYTWFNRFVALRYMELHDYLEHGFRVLSNSNSSGGNIPEVLGKLTELQLQGLDIEYAKQLKLAGNKDGELYRLILIAQCNVLSSAMPFMFEQIDDETELLLPDNLLLTDSIIAKLVKEIPEEDWAQVEIIGWLYQFYVSEKKDEVIGKVVKSEDIPAATQLFTPNWIVQYLVQNSVGRLWMMANPSSGINSQWPYYIKPAEQTPEVNAQLEQLINTRIAEDGTTLNPESITVLDPACGSGHVVVEAYETLKQIYIERGYQPRAIPRLILENNLYGIDIDDRAAQLAGFALLMKARADDRRILQEPPKLNVISLQESKGLNADQLAQSLSKFGVNRNTIADLIDIFQHAKTYGSLIQIPAKLANSLNALNEQCQQAQKTGDLFAQEAAQSLLPLIAQASLLAKQYDAVIANPPYMGNKYLNPLLKEYLKKHFIGFEKDLFSAFMIRNLDFANQSGQLGFMSPFVWMFISSYENLRQNFIDKNIITSLIQLEYSGFDGATVPICTFTLAKHHIPNFTGSYIRLSDFRGSENQAPKTLEAIQNPKCGWFYRAKPDDFKKIPGGPVAYWSSEKIKNLFYKVPSISSVCKPSVGLQPGNTEKFVRYWFEIDMAKTSYTNGPNSGKKWFAFNKGGQFRKWYGNNDFVVEWGNDGELIRRDSSSRPQGRENYFKAGATWSAITSSSLACRLQPEGTIYSNAGMAVFGKQNEIKNIIGLLNSIVGCTCLKTINPTLNFGAETIGAVPYISISNVPELIDELIVIAKSDWDAYEASWDFTDNSVIRTKQPNLAQSYGAWQSQNSAAVSEMKRLEEENNRLFIDSYGLQDELTPDVADDQITLTRAEREKDSQRLISYTIGCMMGRYSLDVPGLIYANAGSEGFDASKYTTFPADADGIVPITDMLWFEDDAANRVQEFLQAVWGKATLDENMAWLAESLGGKDSETPIETIRRYLSNSFYKDHLQTYKKRPIYWHFSSGKQGAFQALVYLHRYNEGTLARMRSEYVVPLMGKLKARIEMLEKDANSATSTAARNKLNKEIEQLKKKQFELQKYDDNLRHHADMRIKLDLDDGVKVNYGKFGDLLSDVKAITGGSDE